MREADDVNGSPTRFSRLISVKISRVSSLANQFNWSGLMLTDLSARFTRMNDEEPKGSNPQSEGKVFCRLGSGRNEEMR